MASLVFSFSSAAHRKHRSWVHAWVIYTRHFFTLSTLALSHIACHEPRSQLCPATSPSRQRREPVRLDSTNLRASRRRKHFYFHVERRAEIKMPFVFGVFVGFVVFRRIASIYLSEKTDSSFSFSFPRSAHLPPAIAPLHHTPHHTTPFAPSRSTVSYVAAIIRRGEQLQADTRDFPRCSRRSSTPWSVYTWFQVRR